MNVVVHHAGRILARLGAAIVAILIVTYARADDRAWRHELTPYLWATAIKSETRNGNGPTVRSDMSPSDLFKDLDAGLMAAFEARKGRWSILLDGMYAEVGPSVTVSNVVAGVPLSAMSTANIATTTVMGALGYRAMEGNTPVDVFFGARYNRIDVKVDASLALVGLLSLAKSPEYRRDWTDPYIGVRIQHPIADKWSVAGYLDAGGFGVGSKNSWQALAGVNYAATETITVKAGYRFLHTDYDTDGFTYKSDIRGLYLGAGFRF